MQLRMPSGASVIYSSLLLLLLLATVEASLAESGKNRLFKGWNVDETSEVPQVAGCKFYTPKAGVGSFSTLHHCKQHLGHLRRLRGMWIDWGHSKWHLVNQSGGHCPEKCSLGLLYQQIIDHLVTSIKRLQSSGNIERSIACFWQHRRSSHDKEKKERQNGETWDSKDEASIFNW